MVNANGMVQKVCMALPLPLIGNPSWFTANMLFCLFVLRNVFKHELNSCGVSTAVKVQVGSETGKSSDRQVLGWVDKWALLNMLARTFLCHSQKRLEHFNYPLEQLLIENILKDIKITWGWGGTIGYHL